MFDDRPGLSMILLCDYEKQMKLIKNKINIGIYTIRQRLYETKETLPTNDLKTHAFCNPHAETHKLDKKISIAIGQT